MDFEPYERKVHFRHDQGGARVKNSGRPFANTLCKMNSNVPDTHITTDPEKVTCRICRKDRRFALLLGTSTRPSHAGFLTRYRRSWRGKLILQVAVSVPYNYDPGHDTAPGGYTTKWRDATLADIGVGVVDGKGTDA